MVCRFDYSILVLELQFHSSCLRIFVLRLVWRYLVSEERLQIRDNTSNLSRISALTRAGSLGQARRILTKTRGLELLVQHSSVGLALRDLKDQQPRNKTNRAPMVEIINPETATLNHWMVVKLNGQGFLAVILTWCHRRTKDLGRRPNPVSSS